MDKHGRLAQRPPLPPFQPALIKLMMKLTALPTFLYGLVFYISVYQGAIMQRGCVERMETWDWDALVFGTAGVITAIIPLYWTWTERSFSAFLCRTVSLSMIAGAAVVLLWDA